MLRLAFKSKSLISNKSLQSAFQNSVDVELQKISWELQIHFLLCIDAMSHVSLDLTTKDLIVVLQRKIKIQNALSF